ncbi:hypothetical protein BC826DRAFT_1018534 [Russula brevipes]|nr:hypothetical protein BC826DRAFT_1018534 [Russula brevipes]
MTPKQGAMCASLALNPFSNDERNGHRNNVFRDSELSLLNSFKSFTLTLDDYHHLFVEPGQYRHFLCSSRLLPHRANTPLASVIGGNRLCLLYSESTPGARPTINSQPTVSDHHRVRTQASAMRLYPPSASLSAFPHDGRLSPIPGLIPDTRHFIYFFCVTPPFSGLDPVSMN